MAEPQIEARYEALAQKVKGYHPSPDLKLLRRAFEFAAEMHDGQSRSSGEPYVIHPLAVAHIIADLRLDMCSLCSGLLHDVVEDTQITVEDIEEDFSPEIAFLVDGLTKLSKMRFNTSEERQAETIRKMIVAMSRDVRVVLVKLADRLHNMRTLDFLRPKAQRRIARETMDIYAPLANRFGINWVKTELEDASFRHLNPEAYYSLAKKIASKRREREKYINEVQSILEEVLKQNGIDADLQGRPKNFRSIYRKMQRQGIDFEHVYDVLAFRIIVEGKHKCYESLGVVHNLWRPIPARFKDYIAMPKPNGYQSLHTSVIGPYREPIEIQIRTPGMHAIAEDGVAAHWVYKEQGADAQAIDVSKFTWLRQLIEDFQEVSDPRDFMERLKMDLFSEEVFAITPAGDIRSFPTGATVVDFAYSIHTEVGDHCSGATVNGVIVPLSYQLKSGDQVRIMTRTSQRPNKDWLDHVKTGRARGKIKHFIQTEARLQAMEIGREILESELRKQGLQLKTLAKKGSLREAAASVKLQSVEEMLLKLGYGTLSIHPILKHLVPDIEERAKKPAVAATAKIGQISHKVRRFLGQKTGVVIDGIDDDLMISYARCCNPVPGEEIIGFITRGRGMSVHSANCARIEFLEPERQIECRWDESAIGNDKVSRVIRLEVISKNVAGLLTKMSSAISDQNININEAHCKAKDGRSINNFDLVVNDLSQLERVIGRVRKVPGVIKVTRIRK